PVEATSELYHLLSKRLRARVAERITLPIDASERDILQETLTIESKVERQTEKRLVEELIAAGGHHPVTLGLETTLVALCEGRIWRLIYSSGFTARGGLCSNCGMLFGRSDGSCDYCGAAIKPVDDLIERTVGYVLHNDGKVEQVAGDAAIRLQQAGSI